MLAALMYLAVVLYTGHEQALEAFMRIGLLGWLFLIACSCINYGVRYLRWQFYLKLNGHCLPHHLSFLYYLSAFALTTTPGKAGETIRSVLLQPHGVPYHTSLACFLIERLMDLVIVTLLSFLILINFEDYTYFIVIFMSVLLLVLPLIRHRFFQNALSKWHNEHKTTSLGRFAGHAANLLQYAGKLLMPKTLYTSFVLGLIAWSVQGIAFYFILVMLGFEVSYALAMGIYAVSLLAGAASFIPGGIGSTELVMGLLLTAIGADSAVAVTAPLISRLSTLWFAVIVGLIATGSINLLRQKTES